MEPNQYELIRQKAVWTDWKFPLKQDVKARQILFDLHDLLPDENIEAFLRDCPAPGGWSYITDEDTGEKSWYWREPFERRQWYASCTIELPKIRRMGEKEVIDYETAEMETAFLTLIMLVEEATDYTARKTDAELAAMYAEFEKARLAGPPNNGTDS